MATTTSDRRAKAPRVALRQSIARYAAGEFTKRDIEKVFASALDQDPACGEVIREYLDQQLHDRVLSRPVYKDLLEQLASYLPEDVPTETAEHVKAETQAQNTGQTQAAATETAAPAAAASMPSPAPAVASEPRSASAPPRKKPQPGATLPKQSPATATPQKTPGHPLVAGTVLRDRFRLDEPVASGSMGLVFRATDLLKLEAGAISPVIAIKVINPEFSNDAAALRSFQNEVANTQHLSHPNIIRLFELDKDQGHYFITMEWLEGESLDALLDRSRGSALPPVQAYAIIEQLCDALIYAHGRQVIHADIKPGNVFLTKPGELKLIDFGIARIHNPHDNAEGKGQQSVALTPAYASCECLEHQTATEQDDLFSLACLIYRLLSGRRVFGTRTALQAEAEKLEPVAIGGMSAQRWSALRKALAYRRADRQPDVRTFADQFGQRSEPRNRIAPEPDDTKFTETTTLGFVAEDSDASLHDTGSLRAMNFPIELDDDLPRATATPAATDPAAQRLEMELELSDVMEASGVLELPEPINFFDEAGCDESIFVPVEEASGQFDLDPLAPVSSTVPAETRLATESTVPTETRVPTESTVPSGPSRSGTIEIEILPLADVASASPAPRAAPNVNSLLDSDVALPVSNKPSSAAVASVLSPVVKPAAPKAPAPTRNAVVEALTAPVTAEPPPAAAPARQIINRLLVQPRYAAALAGGVLVLIAIVFGSLFGDDEAATVANTAQTVKGFLAPAEPKDVRAQNSGADQAESARGQQVLVGSPDEAGSAIDAAAVAAITAEVAAPETLLNTADTGIASDAVAVPIPLGLPRGNSARSRAVQSQPARRPATSPSADSVAPASAVLPAVSAPALQAETVTESAAPAATAAQETTVPETAVNNVGDFDPNGPVPFSALQLAHYVEPVFPEAFSDETIEGWVDVRFSIDTAGSITAVELIDTSLPPDFLPPSRAAVSQWRFQPFVWNGIPLAASTTVRLTYSN